MSTFIQAVVTTFQVQNTTSIIACLIMINRKGTIIDIRLSCEANLFREGLLLLLNNEQDFHCYPANKCSPPTCYKKCCSNKDVAIIDTTSGQHPCLDCTRQIVKRNPEQKIIVLIWKSQFIQVNAAMQYGAMGVLSIEADSSLLMEAVRSVGAGKCFIEPSLTNTMKDYNTENPFNTLTAREHTVLQLILRGKNTTDCAARLYISKKTVANHYTSIRKKLGVDNLIQLTSMAILYHLINPL